MTKKFQIINRILLALELIPVLFLLLLLFLLGAASVGSQSIIFFILFVFSTLSLLILIFVMLKIIIGKRSKISKQNIYLLHLGFLITVFGYIMLLIDGNAVNNHQPTPPYAIFVFGAVACIPYFHVLLINRYFLKKDNKQ